MIRKIEAKDKYAFLEMNHTFYHSEAVLHTIPEKNAADTFSLILNGSPYADAYMLEEDGEICGYVLLALTHSNEAGGLVVWIEEIYIKDNFRGRGLGGRCIEFLKQCYPKAVRFRLEVSDSNEAVKRLYARHGFSALSYQQMVLDR